MESISLHYKPGAKPHLTQYNDKLKGTCFIYMVYAMDLITVQIHLNTLVFPSPDS